MLRLCLICCLLAAPLAAQEPSPEELSRRLDLLAQEVADLRLAQHPETFSFGGYGETTYLRTAGASASWDLHRLVLLATARFSEDWRFHSEIEFEHGDELGVEFAYLEGDLGAGASLRLGHLLVPMGLVNEMHEPTTFPSAERPFVERFILPTTWHENGAGLTLDRGGWTGRAYVMNGFDADGFDLAASGLRGGRQGGSEAAAEELALVARVDWTGTPGLLAGLSAYGGDSGQAAGPDFATRVVDLHAQWQWRALRLRGVWAQAEVADAALLPTPAPGEELDGAYLEAGWNLLAGDPGQRALTPFVRWERLDFAADAPGDSAVHVFTIGISWQPVSAIALKLDWSALDDPRGLLADQLAVTAGFSL